MTDIRTEEGREELGRQVELLEGCCPWTEEGYKGQCSFVEAVRTACTGLGIAEEIAEALKPFVLIAEHLEREDPPSYRLLQACKALAEWDKWKGEPNPRPSP